MTRVSANDDIIKPAHLSLQFRVFLVNAQSGNHTQESRTLNFWFTDNLQCESRPTVAQEFFSELVSPQEFPRGKQILMRSETDVIILLQLKLISQITLGSLKKL